MKKVELTAVIILSITIGGISTSHAYVKRKRHFGVTDISVVSNFSIPDVVNEEYEQQSHSSNNVLKRILPDTKPTEEKILLSDTQYESEEAIMIHDEVITESIVDNDTSLEVPIIPNYGDVSYLGQHYDLGTFSGTGFVPTWTNTVYQWNDFPSHYLVEYNSNPGQMIFGLHVGSEVIIKGQSFVVYNIVYNQANDQQGLDLVLDSGASASMQVCVSTSDDSALNLYFLKEKIS